MPEGMTSIGAFAFFNNTSVTTIYIPNTVTSMGEGIFGGCSSIEMLSIPFVGGVNAKSEDYAYNQTMGYMFYTEEVDGCTAVEQNNITYYIPTSMETLYITNLNGLSQQALRKLPMIKYLELADTMQFVAREAALSMANIKHIKAPFTGRNRTVTTVAEKVFGYWFNYSYDSNNSFPNAVWNGVYSWDYWHTYGYYSPGTLEVLHLTEEIYIPAKSFTDMPKLKTVIFPETLKQIGYDLPYNDGRRSWQYGYNAGAFEGCTSLTGVILPQSLTYLGDRDFVSCKSLTEITIPENVTTILWYSFASCTGIKKVRMENRFFGAGMFQSCTGLVDVQTANASFDYISEYCFNGCTSLKNYYYGEKEDFEADENGNIGIHLSPNIAVHQYAFQNCTSIEYVKAYAITDADLMEEMGITNEYPEIRNNAFTGCTSLHTAYIEGGYIGDSAFASLPKLVNVTLCEGVFHLGYRCFYSTAIKEIVVPSTLIKADTLTEVFRDCESLETVVYKAPYMSTFMFYHNAKLKEVTYDEALIEMGYGVFAVNPKLDTFKLIDDDTEFAFHFQAGMTFADADRGSYGIFYDDDAITTVHFESDNISSYMFYDCTGLTDFKVEENLKNIKYQAFYSDTKLAHFYYGDEVYNGAKIPAGVTVGNYAFYNNKALKAVYTDLAYLGENAFQASTGLVDVTIMAGTIASQCFYNLPNIKTLILGDETTESTGVTRLGWQAFIYSGIVDLVIPSSLVITADTSTSTNKNINAYQSFYENQSLKHLTINNATIAIEMFYNCNALLDVKITDELRYIGQSAFDDCNSMKAFTIDLDADYFIKIPASVTYIGAYAFEETAVERVENYTSIISQRMFYHCYQLNTVLISDNTEVFGESSFRGDSAVALFKNFEFEEETSGFHLNNNVKTINNYAFYGFVLMNKLDLGDNIVNLKRIGQYAFGAWSSLEEARLPFVGAAYGNSGNESHFTYITCLDEGSWSNMASSDYASYPSKLKKIEITNETSIYYGFRGMAKVETLILPITVNSMSEYCLAGCTGLINLTIPFVGSSRGSSGRAGTFGYMFDSSVSNYYHINAQDGHGARRLVQYYDEPELVKVNANWIDLNELMEEEDINVEVEGDSNRSYARDILKYPATYSNNPINPDDKNTEIIENAIIGLAANKNGNVNDSTASNYVRRHPTQIKNITILDETIISTGAFMNFSSVEKFVIPDTVVAIKPYAFFNCTSYEAFEVPDTITEIGNYAYYNCDSFQEINLPAQLTKIGNFAFAECDGIKTLTVPNTLEEVGSHTFAGCHNLGKDLEEGETAIIFESNVLGDYMFANCENITEIELPSLITKLPDGCFYECTGLKHLEFHGDFEEVGAYGFYACAQLESIDLNRVKRIGEYAFYDCSSLFEVLIPETIEGPDAIGTHAFAFCDNLRYVTLETHYLGKYMFYKCIKLAGTKLPNSDKAVLQFAEGLEVIPGWSFAYCYHLEALDFPETLEKIEDYAFYMCNMKLGIVDTKNVTSIGEHAFQYCTVLQTVILSENMEYVRSFAFYGCDNLNEIIIPQGIKEIHDYAFAECYFLEKIVVPQSVEFIGKGAFYGLPYLTEMILPFAGARRNQEFGEESLFGWIFGDDTFTSTAADGTIVTSDYVQKNMLGEATEHRYIFNDDVDYDGTPIKVPVYDADGNPVYEVLPQDIKFRKVDQLYLKLKDEYLNDDTEALSDDEETVIVEDIHSNRYYQATVSY
ncbi:MAG: leucine-rich repeat domain-containing protein, partial [Anaeroplasmataceae bacterium]|nr:leucine-rich repeat domain-containing protein [Anaeroplasmataceae bacterium]